MDLDQVYQDVKDRLRYMEEVRRESTRIRLFDGNWNLWHEIEGEYSHRFKFLENDAGDADVKLPIDHPVAEDVMHPGRWPTKTLYLVFDKDGTRWSGRVTSVKTSVTAAGDEYVEIPAIHDYIKLKELLVWSNPFLLAELQFPKAWTLFGPARWAVATTLLVNLHRKEQSLWMLPDDPLDIGQWVDLDMSNWRMAVKPVPLLGDFTPTTIVTSRFKYFHDCVAPILSDAQLSIEVRRYLPEDGDEQPIPGKNLRRGCLVIDVQDKSGWQYGTSFVGNMLDGLDRGIKRIFDDGMTEGIEYIDVSYPEEYNEPGWFGTSPSAPWVVLEDGPYTGMESSEYEYIPPGAAQFVTGGSSMPGVNEAIKASVIGLGGFLGSFIGQSQAGAVADAILEPLYSDVFMAFQAHKMHDRIEEQGWDYPFEKWVDNSDKAYTLGSLAGLRQAKDETAERHACYVDMADGQPYYVGQRGYGDFFLGDRVAVHARGMPENILFVNRVESLEYSASEGDSGWKIEVGQVEYAKGFTALLGMLDKLKTTVKEQGLW